MTKKKPLYAQSGKQWSDYGHYQLMINPSVKCVGLGLFYNPDVTWHSTVAAEFSTGMGSGDSSASFNLDGSYTQIIEISKTYIKGISLSGTTIYTPGTGGSLSAIVETSLDNGYSAKVNKGATWTSTNESVATVSETGEITAVSSGDTTITVSVSNGTKEFKDSINICVLPEGTTIDSIINPSEITVENRKKPSLPSTIKAKLSNGQTIDLSVSWDSYDEKELNTYFESNDFEIYGDAFGKEVVQKVHVNPVPIPDIECYPYSSKIETDSGKEPVLPKCYIMFPEIEYSYLDMDWDEDAVNHYKDRKGGTFTVNGFTQNHFKTDSDPVQVPSSFTLIVNPAIVSELEIDDSPITTPSGTEPTYPEATVTWSNGDVDSPENPGEEYGYVQWIEDENFKNGYKKKEGGSYVIKGYYHDAVNNIDFDNEESIISVTVNVTPATVTRVEYEKPVISVANGDSPAAELPEKADVSWSNGEKETLDITWDAIPEANYKNTEKSVKTYIVNGIVDCGNGITENVTAEYTVLPPSIKEIETFDKIETLEGVSAASKLPEKAEVKWSNGLTSEEPIDWDEEDSAELNKPDNTFILKGSLKDMEGTEDAVSISVYVKPKSLVSLNWYDEETKKASETQTAKGTVSYEAYNWDQISGKVIAAYDNGTSEVIDIGNKQITASGYDGDSEEKNQTVTLSFTYDNKKDVPVTKSVEMLLTLKKIDKIEFTGPDKKVYLEGQYIDLNGAAVVVSCNDGTTDTILASFEATGDNSSKATLYNGDEAVSDKKLTAGTYSLILSFKNVESEKYPIEVKAPVKNAAASFKADVNIEKGASAEEIVKALVGSTICVPCADGTSTEIVLTKDMIGEPATLGTGAEELSSLSEAEKKMVEDAAAEGKEVKKIAIAISKDADDNPVYSYVYIKVEKMPEPTPTAAPTPTDNITDPTPGQATPAKDPGASDSDIPKPGTVVKSGNASYKVKADGSVTYSAPTNKKITSASVPASVSICGKTYPVTEIADGAFKNCTKLKSVKIGANVTTIGNSTFYKCTSLKSVVIPKKVKKIGKKAFYGCKKLKKSYYQNHEAKKENNWLEGI